MDTLCIPVKENLNPLRLAQIDNMASIYVGALTTLVLDAELMTIPVDPYLDRRSPITMMLTPFRLPCQLRARVICSAWMSRSWTLQEAALAPSITLQFQDNQVSLGVFPKYTTTIRDIDYYERLAAELTVDSPPPQYSIRRIKPLHKGGCNEDNCSIQESLEASLFNDERSVTNVWNSLAGRTTMKSEDVPLIVANLLDLKTYQLVRYGNRFDPFAMIMQNVSTIPFSFLFNQGFVHDPQALHTAWIPRVIGTELLSDRDYLSVSKEHLNYQNELERYETGLALYTSGPIDLNQSFEYLQNTETNACFAFEICPLKLESLRNAASESKVELCFALDHIRAADLPSRRRGACFVIKNLTATPKHNILDLTFYTGIRVRPMESSADIALPSVLQVTPFSPPCHLRIEFGTRSPKPATDTSISARLTARFYLDQRRIPDIRRRVVVIHQNTLTLGFIGLASIMTVVFLALFFTVLSKTRLAFLPFVFLGLGFIVGFALSFNAHMHLQQSLGTFQARWRLRSFENIARERSRRKYVA